MTEDVKKKDLGLEKLRSYMYPGEVFIGNFDDGSDSIFDEEKYMPGWMVAEGINRAGKEAKWRNVRVIDVAFAKDGTQLNHSVALVGTPNNPDVKDFGI